MTKIAFLILFCFSMGAGAKEVVVDKIIAVINEEIKTLSDLKAFREVIKNRKHKMRAEEYKKLVNSDKRLLDKLIEETLISQYVKEKGLESTREEIDNFIKKRMKILGMSRREFERQLKIAGQTLDKFREELKIEQAKAKIFEMELKRKITISENDIEKFFEKKFGEETKITEYRIQHILLKTADIANRIKTKLKSGESFKDIAFRYSLDKGTSNQSGNLGFIRPGDLLPKLWEAIKNMSPGDIKGPVKTKLGFHIIKLVEFRKIKNPEYIKQREAIERLLIDKEFQHQLDIWINQRRDESYVKIFS